MRYEVMKSENRKSKSEIRNSKSEIQEPKPEIRNSFLDKFRISDFDFRTSCFIVHTSILSTGIFP